MKNSHAWFLVALVGGISYRMGQRNGVKRLGKFLTEDFETWKKRLRHSPSQSCKDSMRGWDTDLKKQIRVGREAREKREMENMGGFIETSEHVDLRDKESMSPNIQKAIDHDMWAMTPEFRKKVTEAVEAELRKGGR